VENTINTAGKQTPVKLDEYKPNLLYNFQDADTKLLTFRS